MNPNTECKQCGKKIYRIPSRITGRNFCSIACRNKYFSGMKSFVWKGGKEARAIKVRQYDKDRRLNFKIKAVNLLGGACSICGYNKCIASLDFHHDDALKKDKNLRDMIGACSWKKIEKEVKKCTLLCSNCHRELHWRNNHE